MEAAIHQGAACAPNLSTGARLLRSRIARLSIFGALAALGTSLALHTPWWVRAFVVFVPVAVAMISFLEARSSVCVVGAVQGTYEHDDRSRTVMDPGVMPAVRRVAASITVKSLLVATLAGVAAALTSLAV